MHLRVDMLATLRHGSEHSVLSSSGWVLRPTEQYRGGNDEHVHGHTVHARTVHAT